MDTEKGKEVEELLKKDVRLVVNRKHKNVG